MTAADALKAMVEIERKQEIKKEKPKPEKQNSKQVLALKDNKLDSLKGDEGDVESLASVDAQEIPSKGIARERKMLDKAEEQLKALTKKAEEKQIIFDKLMLELKRMLYIFNKAKEIDIHKATMPDNKDTEVMCTEASLK